MVRIEITDAQRRAARGLRAAAGHLAAPVDRIPVRAVHRRGREGDPAGARGRLPAAVVPAGRALAARARRRAPALARGARLRGDRGPGRGGDRLPRAPRRAGLAAPRGPAHGRRPADGRAAGGDRGRGRPHQRRRGAAQRRGPGLGRRSADAAGGRPAVPPVGQGEHGRRVQPALGPAGRLGDGAPICCGPPGSPRWR